MILPAQFGGFAVLSPKVFPKLSIGFGENAQTYQTGWNLLELLIFTLFENCSFCCDFERVGLFSIGESELNKMRHLCAFERYRC
jgi:hypothetical protein